MGFGDFVDDAIDFVDDVTDRVGEVVEKTAEWVEDKARKLGLGRVADAARMVGRAAKALTIAPTPILRGGQFTIEQILATCGEGEPMERGEAFRDGASAFKAVGERLVAARPGSAWQGTAAKNYANKVSEQENDVAVMVDADTDMATNISDEADLVYRLRELLTRQHQWLADIGSWTQYLGAGGAPGRVMQVEIESWAVGMAMMECLPAAWNTWSDARGIADKIDTITRDEYTQTANEVTISDSTGDFDPPRGAQLETDPQVIRGYAGVQESVAEKTADAGRKVNFVAVRVANNHGLICAKTITAVAKAEAERSRATSQLKSLAADLGVKLYSAADKYEGVDEHEAQRFRQQMPGRR